MLKVAIMVLSSPKYFISIEIEISAIVICANISIKSVYNILPMCSRANSACIFPHTLGPRIMWIHWCDIQLVRGLEKILKYSLSANLFN